MVVEEAPLDVGPWAGAVGPPLEMAGDAVSAPLEVDCESLVWSQKRKMSGVSTVREITVTCRGKWETTCMCAHSHTRTLPNPEALGQDIEEGAVN